MTTYTAENWKIKSVNGMKV